jgi:hypothetical protein
MGCLAKDGGFDFGRPDEHFGRVSINCMVGWGRPLGGLEGFNDDLYVGTMSIGAPDVFGDLTSGLGVAICLPGVGAVIYEAF